MFGGSSLVGDGEVPKDGEIGDPIPSTYVPFRNGVFLALAVSYAEAIGATYVLGGMNALDYSGYPDCRPEFIESFNSTVSVGTKAGVEGRPIRVVAPLLEMKKSEIISLGLGLGVDYGLTWSCYDPDGERPCGHCDSCQLRARGFEEAGTIDPLLVR